MALCLKPAVLGGLLQSRCLAILIRLMRLARIVQGIPTGIQTSAVLKSLLITHAIGLIVHVNTTFLPPRRSPEGSSDATSLLGLSEEAI